MFVVCKLQGCFATLSTFELINVVMCVAFSDGPMEAYVARNEEPMQKQRREETKRITNVEIVWHGCWAKIQCGRQQLRRGPQIEMVQLPHTIFGLLSIFLQKVYSKNTPGVVSEDLPFTPSLYWQKYQYRCIEGQALVELDIQVNSLAQMAKMETSIASSHRALTSH